MIIPEFSVIQNVTLLHYYLYYVLQHSIIAATEPYGLPTENKLLPEMLKKVGYRTHMVGKYVDEIVTFTLYLNEHS